MEIIWCLSLRFKNIGLSFSLQDLYRRMLRAKSDGDLKGVNMTEVEEEIPKTKKPLSDLNVRKILMT